MEDLGLKTLGSLLSQCGAISVLLVFALIYQTLGRAKDRAHHLADITTWTSLAGGWVTANAAVASSLASEKELRAVKDVQMLASLERMEELLQRHARPTR